MRPEWLPYSAAALVTGALTFMLSQLLVPTLSGMSAAELLWHAERQGGTWLTMGMLWALSSAGFILGAPCIPTLFGRRGRSSGWLGAVLFTVGAVGLSGLAVLALAIRALVTNDVAPQVATSVLDDAGLVVLGRVWVGAFFTGLLLIAFGLVQARTAAAWIPAMLLVFVTLAVLPVDIGVVRSVAYLALAAACTGIAVTAVTPERDDEARPRTSSARDG